MASTLMISALLYALAAVIGVAVAILGIRFVAGFGGEERLSKAVGRWGKAVGLSNPQLIAMRSLWRWYRTDHEPSSAPLENLATTEIADLLKKCGLDHKPIELRTDSEEAARAELKQELIELGMEDLEADVVVGMKFNKLGPAGDV